MRCNIVGGQYNIANKSPIKKYGGVDMKKLISTLALVLVLVMCLSVTAMAYSGSRSVKLEDNQNEAYSEKLVCHAAKVDAYNKASSKHNVSAALQMSAGSGWSNYGTVTMAPGSSGSTGIWGRSTVDYFGRATLWIPGLAWSGCEASATITVTE